MKRKLINLSHQYQAALRKHLMQRRNSSLGSARELGRRATEFGLETLDLARIHEQALAALQASDSSSTIKKGIKKRAGLFFAEAITPIEKTHRAALEAGVKLKQRNKTLRQSSMDLATSNRHLKQGIVQRKTVEGALQESQEHYKKLLEESHRLQEHLRHLTHRILSAQEVERSKISRELHDEVAQALLGINVRLLTLKREATLNNEGLRKEIASTQRLVEESAKIINRFAHEFGISHET